VIILLLMRCRRMLLKVYEHCILYLRKAEIEWYRIAVANSYHVPL